MTDIKKRKTIFFDVRNEEKHMEMFQTLFEPKEAAFLLAILSNATARYHRQKDVKSADIGVRCISKVIMGLPGEARATSIDALKECGLHISMGYEDSKESENYMETQAKDIIETLNLKAKGYAQGT